MVSVYFKVWKYVCDEKCVSERASANSGRRFFTTYVWWVNRCYEKWSRSVLTGHLTTMISKSVLSCCCSDFSLLSRIYLVVVIVDIYSSTLTRPSLVLRKLEFIRSQILSRRTSLRHGDFVNATYDLIHRNHYVSICLVVSAVLFLCADIFCSVLMMVSLLGQQY